MFVLIGHVIYCGIFGAFLQKFFSLFCPTGQELYNLISIIIDLLTYFVSFSVTVNAFFLISDNWFRLLTRNIATQINTFTRRGKINRPRCFYLIFLSKVNKYTVDKLTPKHL